MIMVRHKKIINNKIIDLLYTIWINSEIMMRACLWVLTDKKDSFTLAEYEQNCKWLIKKTSKRCWICGGPYPWYQKPVQHVWASDALSISIARVMAQQTFALIILNKQDKALLWCSFPTALQQSNFKWKTQCDVSVLASENKTMWTFKKKKKKKNVWHHQIWSLLIWHWDIWWIIKIAGQHIMILVFNQ